MLRGATGSRLFSSGSHATGHRGLDTLHSEARRERSPVIKMTKQTPNPVHTVNSMSSRTRFLIVSDGRTGTTLLSAILAYAGADFGMPVANSWDHRAGANEHPEFIPAIYALEKAEHVFDLSTRFPGLRPIARFYRSIAKRRVGQLMRKAAYHKASGYMAAYAFKVGFDPRVIASYRRFDALARSKMLQQRVGYPDMVRRFERTYRNALIGIYTFGGCAIDFEELVDPSETGWASALSHVTGIPYQALLVGRQAVVGERAKSHDGEAFRLDTGMDSLSEDLTSLRGRSIDPSPQYRRHANI